MISIITPFTKTHQKVLLEAYESLKKQTYGDWEWVLVPNRGGRVPEVIKSDARIRILVIY